MVYRPTVRYSPVFKDYVDSVFNSTRLDRNQIIRLALFVAAHSKEYRTILEKFKRTDVSLPTQLGQWMNMNIGRSKTIQNTLHYL